LFRLGVLLKRFADVWVGCCARWSRLPPARLRICVIAKLSSRRGRIDAHHPRLHHIADADPHSAALAAHDAGLSRPRPTSRPSGLRSGSAVTR
jgi:hypothetical protein